MRLCLSNEKRSSSQINRLPFQGTTTTRFFVGKTTTRFHSSIINDNSTSSSPTSDGIFSILRNHHEKPWHNEGFLQQESYEYKQNWLDQLQLDSPHLVDRKAFLVVLRAVAESGVPDAPLRAEKLVRKLEKLYYAEISVSPADDNQKRRTELQPNAECYRRVIDAWANAEKEDIKISLIRAEKMLQTHRKSDTLCYNAFLDLCTKGRGRKTSKHIATENAMKAERVLGFMIDDRIRHGSQSSIAPNLDSFNFVIRGWTRCRHDPRIAQKARATIQLLQDYHRDMDSSVRPDMKSYSMLMDAISVQAKHKIDQCHDISNENFNGMYEIASLNRILGELQTRQAAGDRHLVPTTMVYNTIISCWSNLAKLHRNAPLEAEKVRCFCIFPISVNGSYLWRNGSFLRMFYLFLIFFRYCKR